MEKDIGVPKPGDLFIGVIDLFAVLVPGIIAAALIVLAMGPMPHPDVFSVFGLLTAGWVLGHVLHGLGSLLDPLLYDRLFNPRDNAHEGVNEEMAQPSNTWQARIQNYLHKNDDLHRLAKGMTDHPLERNNRTGAVPGGMYQWARAWLNCHSPEATANLDRLEADSKLFRSLAVLLLIAIPVVTIPGPIAISTQIHQAADAFETFVNVEEGAGLAAIAPDLNLAVG